MGRAGRAGRANIIGHLWYLGVERSANAVGSLQTPRPQAQWLQSRQKRMSAKEADKYGACIRRRMPEFEECICKYLQLPRWQHSNVPASFFSKCLSTWSIIVSGFEKVRTPVVTLSIVTNTEYTPSFLSDERESIRNRRFLPQHCTVSCKTGFPFISA